MRDTDNRSGPGNGEYIYFENSTVDWQYLTIQGKIQTLFHEAPASTHLHQVCKDAVCKLPACAYES